MILNYYKTGVRNILKYKAFSIINILGLATGMAVCMLVMVMFSDQKRYDQFHAKKDNIYRILTGKPDSKFGLLSAVTSAPLAQKLKNDYAVVSQSTRLHLGIGGDATYNKTTAELRGYFADPAFFDVFDFPLEAGNPNTALSLPNTMVITHSAAVELFGLENPVGKAVSFADRALPILKGIDIEKPASYWGEYTITGIINDIGLKSHLKFDALMSESSLPILIKENKITDWRSNWLEHNSGYTYVLLAPGKSGHDLANVLSDIVQRQYGKIEEAKGVSLLSQKLTDITPGPFMSSPPGFSLPIQVYYLLAALAIVIMVSACLNYTNLATARSLSRMKEIGIRKVTGANRWSLILQFLSESVITAIFSLGMGIGLLYIIKPAFNGLWINQYLGFDLSLTPKVYLYFVGLALAIGILAGLYPALYLSRFQPIKVLKNQGPQKGGKLTLQKLLGTIQFIVSLFFIVTALLLYNQFRYHLNLEYGFVSRNVINIPLQSAEYNSSVTAFSNVQGVVSISACDEIVGSGQGTHGLAIKKHGSTEETNVVQILANENFVDNLELKIIAGRDLPEVASDNQVVVNQSAVQALGYTTPDQILNETLEYGGGSEPLQVIGVVRDFRFRMASEKEKIEPLLLRHQDGRFRFLQLKVASDNIAMLTMQLEREWKKLDPNHAFKYQFFDEQLRATNKGLMDVVSAINVLSILAVIIACMGLLGMITYQTERKKKEVGIRKILGANMTNLVVVLSRSFVTMLGIAVIFGGSLSYFVNNLWLENFPNRVEFSIGTVLLGAAILLTLGALTIGSQTLRASRANPVDALRAE